MNDRKKHVIKIAHQLFIDKGFQSTSIQDILDLSGISKGTFYNYFSSKNELLVALFKSLYMEMEKKRDKLLLNQDPSNIEIFIKQIEFQMITNRENKLITILEEVIYINDEEVKLLIKNAHIRNLHWLYWRFIDLFGEEKRPYLLDSAIMFTGILHHNMKYQAFVKESTIRINQIVRYSVERIVRIIDEVSLTGVQLISPEALDSWIPKKNNQGSLKDILETISHLKRTISQREAQVKLKYNQLLDFIQIELLQGNNPRKFLIEGALLSLNAVEGIPNKKDLAKLNHLILDYFTEKKES